MTILFSLLGCKAGNKYFTDEVKVQTTSLPNSGTSQLESQEETIPEFEAAQEEGGNSSGAMLEIELTTTNEEIVPDSLTLDVYATQPAVSDRSTYPVGSPSKI